MLDDGEKLVPGFRQARALRVWTGVRPLFEDTKAADTDTRDVTRAHALLDHAERDGVQRLPHDHRRQADDLPADGRGDRRRGLPSTWASSVRARPRPSRCPARRAGRRTSSASGSSHKEAHLRDEQLICECELVPRSKLEEAIDAPGHDQPRRHPPAAPPGDGPVPGRLLHLPRHRDPARRSTGSAAEQADESLLHFLQERWKGVWPILYGDQLRQARLDDWIFQGVLDVEHLPVLDAEAVA